jgi:hypothetical protein
MGMWKFIIPCRYAFLYRKEADQGDATAQFNLGVSYGVGTGVKKDSTRRSSGFEKQQIKGRLKGS